MGFVRSCVRRDMEAGVSGWQFRKVGICIGQKLFIWMCGKGIIGWLNAMLRQASEAGISWNRKRMPEAAAF